MANVYAFGKLTGGTDASYLDYHDGNDLSEGDMAFGMDSAHDNFYAYYLDASNSDTEDSPTVITPDTNSGTKRWVLVNNLDTYIPV